MKCVGSETLIELRNIMDNSATSRIAVRQN